MSKLKQGKPTRSLKIIFCGIKLYKTSTVGNLLVNLLFNVEGKAGSEMVSNWTLLLKIKNFRNRRFLQVQGILWNWEVTQVLTELLMSYTRVSASAWDMGYRQQKTSTDCEVGKLGSCRGPRTPLCTLTWKSIKAPTGCQQKKLQNNANSCTQQNWHTYYSEKPYQ